MGKDSDEIRREIEDTRDRMSATADAIGYKADVPARVKENINDRVEGVRDTIGGAVESVKATLGRTAHGVAGSITTNASQMGDTMGRTASDMTDTASDLTHSATGAAGAFGKSVAQNPLGLALAGLAVGLILGNLLPATDFERDRLGPLTDQLKDAAMDKGQELLDKSKTAVDAAGAAFASSASAAQHPTGEVYSSERERSSLTARITES